MSVAGSGALERILQFRLCGLGVVIYEFISSERPTILVVLVLVHLNNISDQI